MQKVLIFGRGKLYEEKKNYVWEHFEITGFLDNMLWKEGENYSDDGIPVYNPEDTASYLDNDVKIILMSYQYDVMWQQLKKLKIDAGRILFGIMFPPYTEKEEVLYNMGSLAIEENIIVYIYNTHEKVVIHNHDQLNKLTDKLLREYYKEKYPIIKEIAKMDTKPASRRFGLERGTAIDRYYIEHFLEENKKFIYGNCLEIAENTYTLKFGRNMVNKANILHLNGWGANAIKGNLETGEGIETEKYDCIIITQTLMFILNIPNAVFNIYRMLKRNGSALITVSGISQVSRYDADLWGHYYSFYEDSIQKLFEPLFGSENVKVQVYGNVKIACAMLYGLCQEDLTESDFMMVDRDYPVIISAVLTKK